MRSGSAASDPNVRMSTAELRGVLERPTFRRWISAEEATAFVDLLTRETEPCVDPVEVPPGDLMERLRP